MHIQGVCNRKSLSTAEGMFGQLNYEEMLRIKRQHNKKAWPLYRFTDLMTQKVKFY